MAARDPQQQAAAMARRAQLAQVNAAQQQRFELGVQERFQFFLNEFEKAEESQEDGGEERMTKPYHDKVQKMVSRGSDLLEVEWPHLFEFDSRLAEEIQKAFYRLQEFLVAAAMRFVSSIEPDYVVDDMNREKVFQLAFIGLENQTQLRDLRTNEIGKCIRIVGTVTRTGDVRPELINGTFMCMECRMEIRNVVQQFKYTQPIACSNPLCTNRSRFEPILDQSKFIDFQRIKVQELSSEIPAGSMPRTIDIVLRGEIVERAKPGEMVDFCGTLIVVPDVAQMGSVGDRSEVVREAGSRSAFGTNEGAVGLRALGVKELNYKMCFLANNVTVLGLSVGGDGEETIITATQEQEMKRISANRNLYQLVVESVCPTVHGREDIKRGIALQMLGGVGKMTKDGIKLRGDINICIVGDPSTAKSQFLKYVSNFSPRAIYTSGKASSAAGLTASVVRDSETGEFGIEAGALMLADNGVCCIDEFDKMDIKDQVAIHEAMEQQTISIAKAGIQATLNARTSILAAANPRGGRYDNSKPLRLNVDITPPIMSRFDLFFILQDDCNEAVDKDIAQHLVRLHQRRQEAVTPPMTKEELQRYFNYAKQKIHPRLTEPACQQLVQFYKELREGDGRGTSQSTYRITVRQLESMVRLSEALARLHLDPDVTVTHVMEAHRLMKALIIPVQQDPVVLYDGADGDGPDDDDDDGAGNDGDEMQQQQQQQHDDPGRSMADGAAAAVPPLPPRRQTIAITFEKFKAIQSMIVHEMRRLSDVGTDEQREKGVRLGDLIDWYEQQVIDTEPDLAIQSRKFAQLVIRRLVSNERALVVNVVSDPPEQGDDQLLQLHPNMEN